MCIRDSPYDVLNSEEAREEAKGNEKSLYHIIKPEIDFPAGTDDVPGMQSMSLMKGIDFDVQGRPLDTLIVW